ncbi:MAG TPA: ROK family protein [Candidatus Saccharimonadales bacterium]|nr:ROK family protein [Candidatus Saccharimonadales bacterium]
MYLAIDVGATKTLLAVFSYEGKILNELKFPTPQDYKNFKEHIEKNISKLGLNGIDGVGIGMPGLIDHSTGLSIDAGGNLPWQKVNLKKDVAKILPNAKVFIHNDAKLAALSEALLYHKKYKMIMYITLSTGIGGGVIKNGQIDDDYINFEPGRMRFDYEGKNQKWEDFASGKALSQRYGKLAAEINDKSIWKQYAHLVAMGFEELLPTAQPELIIIGGGAGAHLEKFISYLTHELKMINDPLVPLPEIVRAKRPEEAVIFGCYEYIRQNI